MIGDLWALAAAVLLAVVQLTLSSVPTLRQLGAPGSQDLVTKREVNGVTGRFVRAHRNLPDIFPKFVAALFLGGVIASARSVEKTVVKQRRDLKQSQSLKNIQQMQFSGRRPPAWWNAGWNPAPSFSAG